MASTLLVQPDRRFLRDVLKSGGADLKKCYQCATCTAVCSLSTESNPFPRKQMIEAQWGMADRLLADPAVWLCHNCGDCTTRCPRDAKPGEVMGTLRSQAIKHFAFPRFLGSLVSTPKALPLLFLLPLLLVFAIAQKAVRVGSAPWEFSMMFPQHRVDPLFIAVSALVVLAIAVGACSFVKALRASGANGSILRGLAPALVELMFHRRFAKCGAEKDRYWGHLFMFWGFVGLVVVTTWAFIRTLLGIHPPMSIFNGFKEFANVCALIAVVGVLLLLVGRLKSGTALRSSTYFDWFFLLVMATTILSGVASEALRLAQIQSWMYPVYVVHLVLILTLFLYTPYSKFAHFIYRTLALAVTWDTNKPLLETQESVAPETLAPTGS